MKVRDLQAIEILDSRGNPTVRAIIELEDGSRHASSVPSGASTGTHEAAELRDDDKNRYNGKGVLKAVENVNTTIRDAIIGKNIDPKEIDQILIELDGTDNKSRLGANAILSVSMAVTRAAAHAEGVPLWKFLNTYYFTPAKPSFPRLMVNVINGGRHANWSFDIQEFIIIPKETKPSESIRIAAEIFHALGKSLKEKGLSTLVGDEGGYAPALTSNSAAFQTILDTTSLLGYENGKDINLGIDAAASEFFLPRVAGKAGKDGKYLLHKDNKELTSDELSSYYLQLATHYNLLSMEDIFEQDDWATWEKFTQLARGGTGEGLIVVGDDLFCTNTTRIKRGIEEKAANAVLIKVNQIGTVTETAEAINLAQTANWKVAISHRSGETEDSFIADLAYACGADFLKAGSMSRSDRTSKYNRLLEIEKNLFS